MSVKCKIDRLMAVEAAGEARLIIVYRIETCRPSAEHSSPRIQKSSDKFMITRETGECRPRRSTPLAARLRRRSRLSQRRRSGFCIGRFFYCASWQS